MSSTTIGLKVADHTYYPILEKGSVSRKRLVLTTVKDGQKNVQIDLYENDGTDIEEARYVGSLLIEHIAPSEAGQAEIELVLGLDAEGMLTAGAQESTSGEHQSLSVALESLSEPHVYDIPEFELEEDLDTWDESFEEHASLSGDLGSLDDETTSEGVFDEEYRGDDDTEYSGVGIAEQEAIVERRRPIMLGLFIALGVAGVVLIAVLLFKLLEGPTVPPLEARGTGETVETADAGAQGDRDVESAEARASEGEPDGDAAVGERAETADGRPAGGGPPGDVEGAEQSEAAAEGYVPPPAENALGGTWYWIRWGDTLWDLSSSFYRNPRLYPSIAEQNSIENPDLIFAGSRIYIPPR